MRFGIRIREGISKSDLLKKIHMHRYLYLLIIPGLAFFIIFNYAPMYGIQLAFKRFLYSEGIFGSPWVGWINFNRMLGDKDFWTATRNTFVISFGKIMFGFPAPIILALLLNELRSRKYKKFVQSILYIPHFLSWVILSGIIYNLFSVTNGVMAKALIELFNINQPQIISSTQYFRTLVFASHIWKTAGWGTIIYLAAISNIDSALYESAIIDGANRFRQLLHITIPSLMYAIVILLVLNIGQVMNAGFDQIFNLYDASVYKVGDIIDTYTYRIGLINARFEYSTAVGLFKSVINCMMLIFANIMAKRLGQESIF